VGRVVDRVVGAILLDERSLGIVRYGSDHSRAGGLRDLYSSGRTSFASFSSGNTASTAPRSSSAESMTHSGPETSIEPANEPLLWIHTSANESALPELTGSSYSVASFASTGGPQS
jgi:hypothetical protein